MIDKEEGGRKKEEGAGAPQELRARTKAFALAIIRLAGSLPRCAAGQVLGRQVLRSGTSVGANYCEAYRARSKAEFIAKAGDSLREIEETSYWLELLDDSGLADSANVKPLRQESDELTAIFVTILRRAKGSTEGARMKEEG